MPDHNTSARTLLTSRAPRSQRFPGPWSPRLGLRTVIGEPDDREVLVSGREGRAPALPLEQGPRAGRSVRGPPVHRPRAGWRDCAHRARSARASPRWPRPRRREPRESPRPREAGAPAGRCASDSATTGQQTVQCQGWWRPRQNGGSRRRGDQRWGGDQRGSCHGGGLVEASAPTAQVDSGAGRGPTSLSASRTRRQDSRRIPASLVMCPTHGCSSGQHPQHPCGFPIASTTHPPDARGRSSSGQYAGPQRQSEQ